MNERRKPLTLDELQELLARDVLDPEYPIEWVEEELRQAGIDPDQIRKNAADLVAKLRLDPACSRVGNKLLDRAETLPWWRWLERLRLRKLAATCFELAAEAEWEAELQRRLERDREALTVPDDVSRSVLARLREADES